MALDPQTRLDTGTHWFCRPCNWLRRIETHICPACGNTQPGTAKPTPTRRRPKRAVRTGDGLGGLAHLPGHTLWIVVTGKPIGQGSVSAPAAGVIKHDPKLRPWRDAITRECLKTVTSTWEPPSCPVVVDLALTVPLPRGYPDDEAYIPNQPKDTDKLLRAVGDALSPRVTKTSHRFQLLADDGQINDAHPVRTHPRPVHTHPWALPEPGLVLRLAPDGYDIPPLPRGNTSPGELPERVTRLLRGNRRQEWAS